MLYAVTLILTAYGSLYPFDFVRPASDAKAWDAFISNHSLWTSAGDVVGNVLLGIPLGVFAPSPFRATLRQGVGRLAVLAFSLAWMFGLQAAQIYFPPRDASLSDMFWNTVGILFGIAAYPLFAGFAARRQDERGTNAVVPLCLLGAWLATQLAPFVPSLDWQLIKDALKPLLLTPQWHPVALFYTAARVLAAGLLLESVFGGLGACRRRFAVLLVAVLGAKLCIVSQRLTPDNVFGFAVGFAVWWSLGRRGLSTRRGFALAGLFVGYSLASVWPLDWRGAPDGMHLLPFEALLEGEMEVNAWSLVEATYVFGALLWLSRRIGGRATGTTVALSAWVALIEWLQRWIVGRTSDITMPLLVLAIGFTLNRLEADRPSARKPAGPS